MWATCTYEVAIGFCVSIRAVRKWMIRYLQGGVETLADRSSRPGRCRDTLTGE
ncbi:leucine zipper domain-containing protein, partial [uncultured Desulfovibrio sp.]|uniref:leucine zipper domain-containing protein n=1 Tax=uncultured Desulfovibrio sp. TaxID=167968 RepID=UPI00261D9206